MKAMIFAAGLGTRLKQLTTQKPKALVEVGGKPLLEIVLNKLRSSGFTDIVVNVHHFPDLIIDYLKTEYPYAESLKIKISDEREHLLNTGGGLRKAFPLFENDEEGTPVLIHNVDILSNARLPEIYSAAKPYDALLLVSQRTTSRYLLFDDEMRMVGWTNVSTGEVKTPFSSLNVANCKRLAFSGIHVVSPRLAEAMRQMPEEFPIMDFYIKMCATLNIRGYEQPGLRLLDVGKPDTIEKAPLFLQEISEADTAQ